ncbi:glutamate 5-kinase [Carboxydothermus islandicus]|uniref:Glutamate 5-kinase n=1 Tax=Carboxydothermus islandicus TaxID=661089 RepID=A0A1L8D5H4_9THEO|nr:glutamate 5-kinase [Carboxydothermus islandicus]GAV26408.1 glutamate 5-kinase [Carboxydothermus islandicus]
MRDILKNVRRVVVKIGSSSLTHPETGKINLAAMERFVRECADLKNAGFEVIIVSSGAIAAGMGRLSLAEKPKNLPEKQACAAVGQGVLMHLYEKFFSEYQVIAAQVLLTGEDLAARKRFLNAKHTFSALLNYGVVPVVNENDTVAVEEIRFGDNDTLSARVAVLVEADLLVLLSDIDGLYTADPRKNSNARFISEVIEINEEIEKLAGGSGTVVGTGGMETKIEAAKIAVNAGIPMVIARAEYGNLRRILRGEEVGTFFYPKKKKHWKKLWLLSGARVQGSIVIDPGAEEALCSGGKSLLPSGVLGVEGEFPAGAIVAVKNLKGRVIAKGLTNYTAQDILKIKGLHSWEIADVLGHKDYDEIIHRDNLVLVD